MENDFLNKTYLENRSIFQELGTVIKGNVTVFGNASYLLCPYQGLYS